MNANSTQMLLPNVLVKTHENYISAHASHLPSPTIVLYIASNSCDSRISNDTDLCIVMGMHVHVCILM